MQSIFDTDRLDRVHKTILNIVCLTYIISGNSNIFSETNNITLFWKQIGTICVNIEEKKT